MGCAGAAIATITAQAISGILCLVFIAKKMDTSLVFQKVRRPDKEAAGSFYDGNPHRTSVFHYRHRSMVMQSANNGLGSVYVSGFTAGMKIKQFTMCPFDAIGTAVSVFCSQNLGSQTAGPYPQGTESRAWQLL